MHSVQTMHLLGSNIIRVHKVRQKINTPKANLSFNNSLDIFHTNLIRLSGLILHKFCITTLCTSQDIFVSRQFCFLISFGQARIENVVHGLVQGKYLL